MTNSIEFGRELTQAEVFDGLLYHADRGHLVGSDSDAFFDTHYFGVRYVNTNFRDSDGLGRRVDKVLYGQHDLDLFTQIYNAAGDSIQVGEVWVYDRMPVEQVEG